MSNIQNPSNPPPTTPGANPATQPSAPDNPAQASAASLPHTNLDSNVVNKQVNSIFEQAGLVRGTDGALQVKDSASVGKANEVKGLQNFEQVYGSSESQLKPPGPPKVEFTEANRIGAETFAANMDKVIDDILVRPKTQQPVHTKPEQNTATKSAPENETPAPDAPAPNVDTTATAAGVTRGDTQSHGQMSDSSQKQSSEMPMTTASLTPGTKAEKQEAIKNLAPAAKVAEGTGTETGTTKSLWKLARDINQSPQAVQYRSQIAANAVQPATATDSHQSEMFRRITELTADVLLAAFLKLNIMDPNNSVETNQKLHGVMSKLRQRAIADAKQKMKVAEELRLEAEKEAEDAAYISSLMSMIKIVVCVVALLCMFIPGVNAVVLAVVAIVAALVCCAATIVEAKANKDAATASCDAAQAGVMAKRAQLMAERAQEQIEEEAEIIKMIIESKNKMVDSVIRMLNAMFGAAQKLMSAGMAKG